MADVAWLEWRSRGIGASDIAGILGISPWASPYSVWLSKVGMQGGGDAIANAESMRWGHLLESAILRETERRLDIRVIGEQTRCTHPEREFALCTVDAFYEQGGIDGLGVVEVKTTSAPSWQYVPAYYVAQVQWQLEVCQMDRAWVACLHNGRKLSLWPVEADRVLARQMLDIAERFWTENVCAGVPPGIDGLKGTSEALRSQYGITDPDSVIDVEPMADVVEALREAIAEVAKAEETRDALENTLKAYMGNYEIATIGPDKIATWKNYSRKLIDLDKLRQDYPDVAAACTQESQSRRFLLRRGRS